MAQKPQQTRAKKSALPLRKTGTKTAPADLAEFIRLANLVPDGKWLPPELLPNNSGTWTELLERINDPDPLRAVPETVRAELIQQSRRIQPTEEELTWNSLEGWRFGEMLRHYERIRIAYNNLRGLMQTSIDPLNQLLVALGRADLSYLRRCAKAGCERIFYAGKLTQWGCSPEHSSAIRQQRKRDRDKANRHPKKRAKTARKR
jgi:hypothetical protein